MNAAYPDDYDIKVLRQDGKGKGDAVRKGFDGARRRADDSRCRPHHAAGGAAEILCGDRSGKAEFVNGTPPRLPDGTRGDAVSQSHRQQVVLAVCSPGCSTSASPTRCAAPRCCRDDDYERLGARTASYFGDFDPFGDFDLIFGAAKLNLKIVEVPVRYAGRIYGETQISRFRHGWLLLRMVGFAYMKLKAL